MKKPFVIVLLLVLVCSTVFSAVFHSVPLDNEAYRIIDSAEVRGIIPLQSDVKPYNLNKVRTLLNTISASADVTESEKKTIENVLSSLDYQYGEEPSKTVKDVFANGYYGDTFGSNNISVGGRVDTTQTIGKSEDDKVFDSRNGVLAYVMGDLFGAVSYDLNFKLNFDKLDVNASLPTELKFNTDGFYLTASEKERLRDLPDDDFYVGIEAFPEISTSIKDVVDIRIGTVKRDWGPGKNNIAISGSARAMDGFELTINPAPWFSYSVMTASLGHASLNTVNGVDWPSESMDKKDGKYYNNLSAHRVELTISNFKFNVWESVVWRKRFELAYLNPLTIYMFTQNNVGDYDNVLAGFDISVNIPHFGTIYGALSMDELNSFKKPFSCPRNILSYQLGGKFSIPGNSFSLLQVQATYIPAFYGAHYADKAAIFGDVEYTTAYVNKGQNIGYPVNPDTFEVLFSYSTTIAESWKLNVLLKDQMRSAQYATKKTGTDILTWMDYDSHKPYDESTGLWGKYESRDFFHNIWNNIIDMEVTVEKKLSSFPLTFIGGVQGILENYRDFTPTRYGNIEGFGEWQQKFTINASFGIKLYY